MKQIQDVKLYKLVRHFVQYTTIVQSQLDNNFCKQSVCKQTVQIPGDTGWYLPVYLLSLFTVALTTKCAFSNFWQAFSVNVKVSTVENKKRCIYCY